jgi:hypothetical protein
MAVCSLRYSVSVTGDCLNTGVGAFTVSITGTTPPFYYQFISPFDDPIPVALGNGVTSLTRTNLTPNTYTLVLFDSCSPPTQVIINAVVSDGVCVSLLTHENTTCGLPNGSITATTDNNLISTQYFLYENTRGLVNSGSSVLDYFIFNNLSAGTYYVTVNDGGGCSGKSESCIIKPSTEFDYGFYVVDDSTCTSEAGKVFITGLTGFAPYTYSWSNGTFQSSISGLSSGIYSVNVTDSTGCLVSKNVVVGTVPQVGFAEIITIAPSCFGNDGQITVVVTGGTAPYYYQASNGQSLITFSETYTLSGLASNNYVITVTDAALCTQTITQPLTPPNGFTILNVGIINSTCNNSSGAISPITILGGTPPFVYNLTYPSGNSIEQTVNGFSNQFQGLSAGTYTLTISNGPCIFSNTYTINNTEKYTITTSSTGTTCQGSNGRISVAVSSGATLPLTYQLTGQPTISNTSQTAVTFNNLFSGNYQLTVTDAQSCTQTQTINVTAIDSIDFSLVGTNLTGFNNGTIQLYITEGPAPYTIQWSNNVNGQTGTSISNLSAGTYGVLVTDSNGCQLSREITLQGYNNRGSYEIYNYCQSEFVSNGLTILKKTQQMFLEGYYDLLSGETNCVLNEATFIAEVIVDGNSIQQQFYVSNSLSDYPTDEIWIDTIEGMLLSFEAIGNVIINTIDNQITIESSCSDLGLSLSNAEVQVNLRIEYDVSCVCSIEPTPGPAVEECDMLYINGSSEFYIYTFSSNTSTLLTVDQYDFNSNSIAFTTSKLWAYFDNGVSTTIREWYISTSQFTSIFNRQIFIPFLLGDAIYAKNDNLLVGVNASVSPNRFVEIDITGLSPVVTNKTYLGTNRSVLGSIANNENGQFLILQTDTTFAPFNEYYISLIDSDNYNNLFDINITLSIFGEPAGVFMDGSQYYLVDDISNIYTISNTPPYTVTLDSTVGGASIINSLTQLSRCFTEIMELPSIVCGESPAVLLATGDLDGIYDTYLDLGESTGNVEITFNTIFDQTPVRYQIIWNGNIVADSLFLGEFISSNQNMVDEVLNTTTLNKYVYYNGNGNASTVQLTTDWYTNGQEINVNYTLSNIAGNEARGNGGSPGQIGVVPDYPFVNSPAFTPDIKLGFNKTSAEPRYVTIRAIGLSSVSEGFNFAFQFGVTLCP